MGTTNKYVTLKNGTDFRKIAKLMSKVGYPMNHATARNLLILSLESMFVIISQGMGLDLTEEQIKEILKNSKFHDSLSEILFAAYHSQRNKVKVEEILPTTFTTIQEEYTTHESK